MILIANVGNRNFTYNGAELNQGDDTPGKPSFLTQTKTIYENLDTNLVKLNILGNLLDANIESISHIYLIGSHQPAGSDKTQDTYIAARILQSKILAKYERSDLKVEIRDLPFDLSHTADVMQWYKENLIAIERGLPNQKTMICDAGGAPQMKLALKIMAEYIFPVENLIIKYVQKKRKENTEKIIDADRTEYRKVITSYQVESLINRLNYYGASFLWNGMIGNTNSDNTVSKLLEVANLYKHSLLSDQKLKPEFLRISSKMPHLANVEKILNKKSRKVPVSSKNLKNARVKLSLVSTYYKLNQPNELISAIAQFYEFLLNALIAHCYGLDIAIEKQAVKQKWYNAMVKNKIVEKENFSLAFSLPSRQKLLRKTGDNTLDEFINSIRLGAPKKVFQDMRNQLFHNGKSISIEDVHEKLPKTGETINFWKSWLDIPEADVFDELNAGITLQLKKY